MKKIAEVGGFSCCDSEYDKEQLGTKEGVAGSVEGFKGASQEVFVEKVNLT